MTEIYKRPCGPCPTARGDDPEIIQMREWYRTGQITAQEMVFRCAWRRKKICRGIADFAGITEADLQEQRNG